MAMTPAEIIKRVDSLDADMGVWRTHWQELYDYILPRKATVVRRGPAGEKRGQAIFDNTAMVACDILAGALHGMLTNPNQLWFELQAASPEMNELIEVKEYLQELTMRMHTVLNRSNFQTEVHEMYLDLVTIGTATMYVEEDDANLVNFSTRFIEEIRIVENSKGRVEEVHRIFKWDAKKIVEEFADENDIKSDAALSAKFGGAVARSYKSADPKKFKMCHAVYREKPIGEQGRFPFVSQYVIHETKKEVRKSGFREFPYVTPRWSKVAGETYGRGPGMNALPECKTLNLMAKTVIKGAQKTVDPPLQAPDDGFSNPKRTNPGSLHYYRAGSKDRIEPIYNDARIDFGFQAVRDRQIQIQKAFFVDRLNIDPGDRATQLEISQRVEEQFRFLGPMLGRQQTEFLKPLITRVLDIMTLNDRDGDLIGQPPDALVDVELDVVYTSPIARSQRADQGQTMLKAWQSSLPVMELFPEAADLVNADAFLKHNWDVYGAPQKVLRNEEEVEQIRDSRAQAQQEAVEQQQQSQQIDDVSKLAPGEQR